MLDLELVNSNENVKNQNYLIDFNFIKYVYQVQIDTDKHRTEIHFKDNTLLAFNANEIQSLEFYNDFMAVKKDLEILKGKSWFVEINLV